MLKKEKLLAVLRLQKTKNVGDILAKKLIAATGDIAQIFHEKRSNLLKINGIGTYALKDLFNKETLKHAENEYEFIQANSIGTSYFLDDDYPKNLQNCIDAPILIFKDGNINLNNDRILSIVGTRNMTSYGRAFCKELIQELRAYHPVIISGFAYGVDICAHQQAIENDLQTIAVLAHGFDYIYPKSHKKYVHQLNANGGFITEFWHGEEPLREHFLRRNRIVAGISQATIVIESARKGGALVTADIANSYGRDVFAVPGRTSDSFSEGCNHLVKDHKAAILTKCSDITKMLNWDLSPLKKPRFIQRQLVLDLNDLEQKVYAYLFEHGKQTLDVLAVACSIPVYKLAPMLLQLEMKGVLRPLPGKFFELV